MSEHLKSQSSRSPSPELGSLASKRSKGVANPILPSSPSSTTLSVPVTSARPHLKVNEELLDSEKQAKLIQRRVRDAERKRKEREKLLAKRPDLTERSESEDTFNVKSNTAASFAPAPSATSNSKASSSTAALNQVASTSSSSRAKSSNEKKAAAATEKASSAAQKLAAERAAVTAADAQGAKEEEEEEDAKLYCICKTLYDEERMMIACDRCDEWYHALCMQMNDEQTELVDLFVCPRCQEHTSEKTTYKPACLRYSCTHAARSPLSRYCSDRCGLLVAAARVARTQYAKQSAGGLERLYGARVRSAVKREGMVQWVGDNGMVQLWLRSLTLDDRNEAMNPATSGHIGIRAAKDLTAETEALANLRESLTELSRQRQASSILLDLAESRLKLLQLVDDRLEVLPPIAVEETDQPLRKTKAKGRGNNISNSADSDGGTALKNYSRCGFDGRLSWSDERFGFWMTSQAGREILEGSRELDGQLVEADSARSDRADEPVICGVARRKCRRHADWSLLRGEEFEIEKASQTNILSNISQQIAVTQARIMQLDEFLSMQRLTEDEKLAQTVAKELGGTRGKAGSGVYAFLANGRH